MKHLKSFRSDCTNVTLTLNET